MEREFGRYFPDMGRLHAGSRTQPCFVCRLVAGDGEQSRCIFYEDDRFVAFLDAYPRAYGYSLVAVRMYPYTFGSNEGNAHVHWHGVPLPPGAPYKDQQGAWASWERGVLAIPEREMENLSGRLAGRM